jgi:hypothetical protein
VFAAAVFHGAFNAAATLVVFIHGRNAFSVGFTGAAGLVTFLLADVALWVHLRRRGTDKNMR